MADKTSNEVGGDAGSWERNMLRELASAGLREQRRSRRWGIFFKLLTFAYLTLFILVFGDFDLEKAATSPEPHTAVVDLKGVIAPGTDAAASSVIKGLRAAFEDDNSAAVILRINSPGGSPVQARYINAEMLRLREAHPDVPLYAVVADVGASGAYYAAAAAEQIYVDESSLVGSIGVRMDGFGFVDAIDRLGVTRRLMTAGDHKVLLDPFLPVSELDREHVQSLLNDIHRQFIAAVKEGRGDRLGESEELYSGLVWTGDQAVGLGLADGIGSADLVAQEVVGADTLKDFTRKRDWLERFSDRLGTAVARELNTLLIQPRIH